MAYREVFVVGCPRSGTTYVARRLAELTANALVPEAQWLRLLLTHAQDRHALAGSRTFSQFWGATTAMAFVPGGSVSENAHAMVAAFLQHAGFRAGGAWIEHTPQNLFITDELERAFPNACFVHIIRNPMSVVQSLRGKKWGPYFTRVCAAHWKRCARVTLRSAQKHKHFVVRYETVVESGGALPEAITAQVLRGPGYVDAASGRLDAALHGRLMAAADGSRIDAWRRELSQPDIERIYRHSYDPELDRLYRLYPPMDGQRTKGPSALDWMLEKMQMMAGIILRRTAWSRSRS